MWLHSSLCYCRLCFDCAWQCIAIKKHVVGAAAAMLCLFLWPCNALVSQITTITEVQTEDLGHQAAHRLALQLTQHWAQHRDPMVHTTRTMEPTLPLLPASFSKRNPLCTKEGKHLFQVPQGQIVGLQGATSLAAAQVRAPITSMARATGRERRVSTRTRGEQVDTRTALHTRAKWQEELEVIKISTLVKCWDFKDSKKIFYLYTFSSLIVIVLVQVSTTSPVTTHREVEEVATRALVLSTTTRWATAEATAAWTTSTDRLRPSICESPAPSTPHQYLKPSPKKVIDGLPVLSAFSMFASYVLLVCM